MEGDILRFTSGAHLHFEGKQLYSDKQHFLFLFLHTGQMRVLVWLSVSRVGVLAIISHFHISIGPPFTKMLTSCFSHHTMHMFERSGRDIIHTTHMLKMSVRLCSHECVCVS